MYKSNYLVKSLSLPLISRSSSTVSMPECSVKAEKYKVSL